MSTGGDSTVPARPLDGDAGGAAAPATAPRYELGEQLGVGGMAVVWAAHDRALDRAVALKVLHDRFLGAAHQERLAAEARAMARLSHPNVVAVYDVGERDGRTFVAMEQVRGGSLAAWVREPRPWPEVVEVFRAAGAGLAAAHAAGVVHRDVKPSNILVGDDGRARVADFGVAIDGPPVEVISADPTTTLLTAGINGTPAYMAPERLRGKRADPASDQFSFAAALYEVLHGRRPFTGATLDELATAATRPPPPPVRPVPRWLHAVVERGLAADPARRFPSIAAMVEALDDGRRRRRRRRWTVAAVAGALALGGAATALVAAGPDARTCPGGAAAVRQAWDDGARARVTAAFAGSRPPYAAATGRVVVGQLERYADAWARAQDAACAAPATVGPRAPVPRATRLACLATRRDGLRQLADALARVDERAIARASAAIHGLPAIADCEDPALAPATLAGPVAARADLMAARIALATGDLATGRARAARAAAAARAAGHDVLAAEALLIAGRVERADHRPLDAVARLHEATDLARTAGARALLVEALVDLADALPSAGRRAESTRTMAELAVEEPRVHDPARRLGALTVEAYYFGRDLQFDRALGAYGRALALVEEIHGPDAVEASAIEVARADALRELGRADDALTANRRALALALQLGEAHPDVGRRRRELATTLAAAGDEKEAHGELQRAVAILEAALGADDEEVASVRNALALSMLRQGQAADAVVQLEAAAASDASRPPSKQIAARRTNLATALLDAGRPADAEPVVRAALAMAIAETAPDHVSAVHNRRVLARVLAALGRTDEALVELTRARTSLATARFSDAEELARARRDEGEVLRRAGRAREALAADLEAWEIVSRRLAPGHRERGETQRALAEDHLALGEHDRATARAEEAIVELTSSPPVARAAARWVLARALWAAGHRERATAMATVARADAGAPTAAAIDGWLASR